MCVDNLRTLLNNHCRYDYYTLDDTINNNTFDIRISVCEDGLQVVRAILKSHLHATCVDDGWHFVRSDGRLITITPLPTPVVVA